MGSYASRNNWAHQCHYTVARSCGKYHRPEKGTTERGSGKERDRRAVPLAMALPQDPGQ
jgi:hypothetical protein